MFQKHIVVVSEHYMARPYLANIFIPLPQPTHNSGWNSDFIHTHLGNVNPSGSAKLAELNAEMSEKYVTFGPQEGWRVGKLRLL